MDGQYKVIQYNDLGLPERILFTGDRARAIEVFNQRRQAGRVCITSPDIIWGNVPLLERDLPLK